MLIPIMKHKSTFFYISGLLVILGILLLFVKGLNYGIDFKGGILLQAHTQEPADMAAIRSTLGALDLGEVALQTFGTDDDVLIRIEKQQGGDAA